MKQARTLVLLEFPEDVEIANAKGLLVGGGVVRLALAPGAAERLQALGIDHCTPHQLVSSRDIQRETDRDGWTRLDRLAGLIEQRLGYGWVAAYYLKILLDSCMEKTIQLVEAIRANRPDRVFFVPRPALPVESTLAFDEQESLYGRLLPWVLARYTPSAQITRLFAKGGWLRAYRHRLRQLAVRGRAVAATAIVESRQQLRGPSVEETDGSICLVEAGYGIESILGETGRRTLRLNPTNLVSALAGGGPAIVSELPRLLLRSAQQRTRARTVWKELARSTELRQIFTCRDVNLFPVVESRLRYLLTRVYPDLPLIEQLASRYLKRNRVQTLVSSYFSRPATQAVARAARSLSVPIVTVQHSAYGFWHWPLAKYFDGVMSDFKLVGGEGTRRYVVDVEKSGTTPVSTGMLPLERLSQRRRGQARARPLVVYPLASYVKNFVHFSNTRLSLTEYFDINCQILGVLGRHSEVDVVLKVHPAWQFKDNTDALRRFVSRSGWSHIRFDGTMRTVDWLAEADLVVIDSASTVLMQAAASRARIMLFNRAFRFTEEGRRAIQGRASFSEDLESFCAELDRVLGEGSWKAATSDEFLRLFAVHQTDGQVAARAAAAITAISEGRSPLKPARSHSAGSSKSSKAALRNLVTMARQPPNRTES